MDIKINTIIDNGTHNSERVVFDVINDTRAFLYLVLDTTYTDIGELSNRDRHVYWFPDVKLKNGDRVILYTKKGNYSKTLRSNGSYLHVFYWGLNSNVWNDEYDEAILIKIDKLDIKGK